MIWEMVWCRVSEMWRRLPLALLLSSMGDRCIQSQMVEQHSEDSSCKRWKYEVCRCTEAKLDGCWVGQDDGGEGEQGPLRLARAAGQAHGQETKKILSGQINWCRLNCCEQKYIKHRCWWRDPICKRRQNYLLLFILSVNIEHCPQCTYVNEWTHVELYNLSPINLRLCWMFPP